MTNTRVTVELPTQLYTQLEQLAVAEQTTPADLLARLITLRQQSAINTAFDDSKLSQLFEPLIRRVIQEELADLQNQSETFYLTPSMPLYDDMLELVECHSEKKITFHSHQEVWDKQQTKG